MGTATRRWASSTCSGSRRQEACERMHGRQAGVAGSNTILPFCIEVIQKGKGFVRPQVQEFQIDHPTAMARGEKAQKEHERIAVTRYRPRAEATREWQMLGEEGAEGDRKLGRGGWCHGRPPSRALGVSHVAEWMRNRSLAASAVASRNVK